MKIDIIFFLFIVLFYFSCQGEIGKESVEQKVHEKDNFKILHIEVITAELPIKLDLIDFEDRDLIQQISDGKMSRIEEVIKKYYLEECDGNEESPYDMKDVYLKTIQINNSSNYQLYWIIFKHISSKVNSKILFFDKRTKEFSEYIHDLNIHALYHEENKKLTPSNLKQLFKFDFPEIELVNFDEDEISDFKLRRLYHNGTENAIEEIIIEVNQVKADTLKFEKYWMVN